VLWPDCPPKASVFSCLRAACIFCDDIIWTRRVVVAAAAAFDVDVAFGFLWPEPFKGLPVDEAAHEKSAQRH
jgi:hypothetical protein